MATEFDKGGQPNMERQSTLPSRVSLDANGELLINGQRASTNDLEALLTQESSTIPTPNGPVTVSSGGPTSGSSRVAGVEPFARAGILSLFVVVFAAALKVAFAAYTKARIIRVFAGLNTTFGTADGLQPPPVRSTTNPIVAAIVPFLVLAIVGGAIIGGLRWWHQRSQSIEAVGVSLLVATAGVFVFANDLWSWASYLEHNPFGMVVSEALKKNTTWASLLGLGGSVAALGFLGIGVKAALDCRA
jgi:hypothetical protein